MGCKDSHAFTHIVILHITGKWKWLRGCSIHNGILFSLKNKESFTYSHMGDIFLFLFVYKFLCLSLNLLPSIV